MAPCTLRNAQIQLITSDFSVNQSPMNKNKVGKRKNGGWGTHGFQNTRNLKKHCQESKGSTAPSLRTVAFIIPCKLHDSKSSALIVLKFVGYLNVWRRAAEHLCYLKPLFVGAAFVCQLPKIGCQRYPSSERQFHSMILKNARFLQPNWFVHIK